MKRRTQDIGDKESEMPGKQPTNIMVMSFEDACLYTFMKDVSPFIIISIDDKGFSPTPFNMDCPSLLSVLKLHFSDYSFEADGSIPDHAMTEEDADKIARFVEHWLPARPEILVHCAAGISRSAGIAAAFFPVHEEESNDP